MAGRVVIIGGGASGLLTAVHLKRIAASADVTVVEPGEMGAGIAYSTTDGEHRLNVPAAGMTALPDEPEHFLQWLRTNRDPDFPAGGFARRLDYLAYLQQLLAEAGGVRQVRALATSLTPDGPHWRIGLDDGRALDADDVVLALGNGVPSTAWAPRELLEDVRFVADPWAAPVPDGLVPGPRGTVLLVGAGLTMADMAISWGRRGATVHVVSRHGLLPLAHSRNPNPRPPAPELPDTDSIPLAEATALVETTVGKYDDWRDGIDSLRPVTAELWQRIPVPERAEWLKGQSRYWNRARHRVAPDVGDRLEQMLTDGTLVNHTGSYADVATILEPDVIVNCTGPANEPARSDNPLVRTLLAEGVAQPHPVGLGLAVEQDGRLAGYEHLWTIGPLRQGELFETTAIPEIRGQAADLARQLLG